jgi:L-asparagine transporter-like permease
MELYNILVFAIIGALCMFIVTGGFLSMTGSEPTSGSLSAGASVGAAIGSAAAFLTGGSSTPVDILSTLSGGSATPEMKVGLPGF